MEGDTEGLTDARRRSSRAMRRIKGSGFPARRHGRVCILSPDAVRAIFPLVSIIFTSNVSALFSFLFVDEDSAPDSSIDRLGIAFQLRALSLCTREHAFAFPIHDTDCR